MSGNWMRFHTSNELQLPFNFTPLMFHFYFTCFNNFMSDASVTQFKHLSDNLCFFLLLCFICIWCKLLDILYWTLEKKQTKTIDYKINYTYFHVEPRNLLKSEFLRFGFFLAIIFRAWCENTMKAFIGRLMRSSFCSVVALQKKRRRKMIIIRNNSQKNMKFN